MTTLYLLALALAMPTLAVWLFHEYAAVRRLDGLPVPFAWLMADHEPRGLAPYRRLAPLDRGVPPPRPWTTALAECVITVVALAIAMLVGAIFGLLLGV